jgi:hypothetical protein
MSTLPIIEAKAIRSLVKYRSEWLLFDMGAGFGMVNINKCKAKNNFKLTSPCRQTRVIGFFNFVV